MPSASYYWWQNLQLRIVVIKLVVNFEQKLKMCVRPMAIWRDEVKAAVNTSVGSDATIHAWLGIHEFFISQVDVVNQWPPTATTKTSFIGSLYLSLTPKFKTYVLHRSLISASNTGFKPNVELGLVLNFSVNFEFVASAFGFTPKLIRKGLAI